MASLSTKHIILVLFLGSITTLIYALPSGFVYLHDIAPSIVEDIRYAGRNNFIGQPIPGYQASRCILTRAAAMKLQEAQNAILMRGYSLKVYDCYRPQMAVSAFSTWSKDPKDTRMQPWFYPEEQKKTLFDKGYIAEYSGHSRGSTVDLTLIRTHHGKDSKQSPIKLTMKGCNRQMYDNSINMGTPFDCFDKSAHVFYQGLNKDQYYNRMVLRNLMIQHGFIPYSKEWWHFTLGHEPYPHTYFNFIVQ